ncbi:MAG: acetyl-CoA carboxylase biotin carboxyl carrier protein [Alphaproteobacteria bacterium]|nr:acetyl-CoA carboxylase biotin carboxyl carrier protein [Alphaproteobacteria bacterium]
MAKFDIDRALIRELAALLAETGLSEIEVADKDHRLRVARQAAPVAFTQAAPTVPGHRPGNGAEPAAPVQPGNHPGALTSPMVGTVYLSPEPDKPPFVRAGQSVVKGQTLLLIEAMKTYNEIAAPRDGRVTLILVENGAPVEYAQALLVLE